MRPVRPYYLLKGTMHFKASLPGGPESKTSIYKSYEQNEWQKINGQVLKVIIFRH